MSRETESWRPDKSDGFVNKFVNKAEAKPIMTTKAQKRLDEVIAKEKQQASEFKQEEKDGEKQEVLKLTPDVFALKKGIEEKFGEIPETVERIIDEANDNALRGEASINEIVQDDKKHPKSKKRLLILIGAPFAMMIAGFGMLETIKRFAKNTDDEEQFNRLATAARETSAITLAMPKEEIKETRIEMPKEIKEERQEWTPEQTLNWLQQRRAELRARRDELNEKRWAITSREGVTNAGRLIAAIDAEYNSVIDQLIAIRHQIEDLGFLDEDLE